MEVQEWGMEVHTAGDLVYLDSVVHSPIPRSAGVLEAARVMHQDSLEAVDMVKVVEAVCMAGEVMAEAMVGATAGDTVQLMVAVGLVQPQEWDSQVP